VLIFPFSLFLGILAGVAAGGRPGALSRLRLRQPGIVLGALALQAFLTLPVAASMPAAGRMACIAASYAAAGGWLLLNVPGRSRPLAGGLAVTGLGWVLNMCVVVANVGMPVSLSAMSRAGLSTAAISGGGPLGKHVALVGGSALGFLGDTIPVPTFASVVSIGDLVMMVGIVVAIAAAMCGPRLASERRSVVFEPAAAAGVTS
jgi:hypothetical protein